MVKSLYLLELDITMWKVKIKMFYIDNLPCNKHFIYVKILVKFNFSQMNTGIFFLTGKITQPLFCMVN